MINDQLRDVCVSAGITKNSCNRIIDAMSDDWKAKVVAAGDCHVVAQLIRQFWEENKAVSDEEG